MSDGPNQEQKPFDRMLFVVGLSMCGGAIITLLIMTLIPGTRLQVVVDDATNPITVWELFSYAGILITILAFLAAFFILFMAFDAFAVSKAIERNKESLQKNQAIIKNQKKNMKRLGEGFLILEEESKNQHRMVSLNGLFIRELAGFQKEFSLLETKFDVLASHMSASDELNKLSRGIDKQDTRQARLDALSYLANGFDMYTEHTEDALQSSAIELINSILERQVVDDATVLMLLHQNGLLELDPDVLTIVAGLVDSEKLKASGLLA